MRSAILILSFVSIVTLTTEATSQDGAIVCVSCSNPSATYRCEVLPPEVGVMAQSPQIFCAAEMARNNGHSTCVVQRNVVATHCPGQSVVLAYTGPVNEEGTIAPAVGEEAEPAGPPKTLIEATDRAVKSTGKQIKKAGESISSAGKKVSDVTKKTGKTITDTGKSVGDTVSNAAKSSWKCLTSLFQSC